MSYEDTYNTLKYADRAKSIKSKLVRNVLNVDFHVSRYAKIVEDLRTEVCGKHQPEQACFMPLSRVLSSLVRAHFPKSGAGYDAYKQNRVVFYFGIYTGALSIFSMGMEPSLLAGSVG